MVLIQVRGKMSFVCTFSYFTSFSHLSRVMARCLYTDLVCTKIVHKFIANQIDQKVCGTLCSSTTASPRLVVPINQ